MNRFATLVALVLALGFASSTVMAASTSPGKSSVYVSNFSFTLAEWPNNALSGTILKGKAHTVLEIHTMISSSPGVPVHLLGTVTVNSVAAEPSNGGGGGFLSGQDCRASNSAGCTLTDVRWVDIDAAEAANPGMFVGQPLVINFLGGVYNGAGAGSLGFSNLTVHVQKK